MYKYQQLSIHPRNSENSNYVYLFYRRTPHHHALLRDIKQFPQTLWFSFYSKHYTCMWKLKETLLFIPEGGLKSAEGYSAKIIDQNILTLIFFSLWYYSYFKQKYWYWYNSERTLMVVHMQFFYGVGRWLAQLHLFGRFCVGIRYDTNIESTHNSTKFIRQHLVLELDQKLLLANVKGLQ